MCTYYIAIAIVGSENPPGVVTRAGVEAEGRPVGPRDHKGRINHTVALFTPISGYIFTEKINCVKFGQKQA